MIEPMTHCGQSPLQAFALLLPERFLAAFIGEQGFFKLHQNIVRDMDVTERAGEPVAKFFLAEVRQIAFSSIAGATVVGVTVLLEFRRDRAVVIGAMQQAGESEVMFSVFGFVVAAKDGLHLLEQFRVDERRVRAVIELVFPDELSFVERVL
ncbi:MAG TPA: hypothetical protein VJP02_10230 [Candidatus Sulfotelmatobacter sp.]|nr:hypothetical protein [Candidatus Sulfotelmatobacter sp.]